MSYDVLAAHTKGQVTTPSAEDAVITVTQELKAVLVDEETFKAVLKDDN